MSRIDTERFRGDCLAGLGFPDKGTVLIDREMKPELFDIVYCDCSLGGSVHGYLKQFIDDRPQHEAVRTRYRKDGRGDWQFHPAAIWGVVLEARNEDGEVVYTRPERREVRKVVLCKDCINHYYDVDCGGRCKLGIGDSLLDEDFCSRGERRPAVEARRRAIK